MPVCLRIPNVLYRLTVVVAASTSFTWASDTRSVRAMAFGFMPDWADALIRLALPNGKAEAAGFVVALA